MNVTVTATNRYTAGHAIVSVVENGDGEMGPFDLSPQDVKEILALFRGKDGKSDDEPGDALRFEVTDQHTVVTDVSGLFAGKQLQLPRYPSEENFPDVAWLVRQSLAGRPRRTERLFTTGRFLGFFRAAATAYGEPLVIESSSSKALTVMCGESFVGLLMPLRQDDDTENRHNEWRLNWLQRLPTAPRRAQEVTTS